jgi:hypothetical protein
VGVDSFFRVFVDDVDEFAEAKATHDPELGKRVRSGGLISDWKPLQFSVDGGLLTDYLANSFAFRLCSEKLRGAIDSYRVNIDEVKWLPSVVTLPAGHEFNYWVLHFPAPPDVLSTSESIVSGARVIKPVLDPNLVNGHRVFSFPHDSVSLIIAGILKTAIETAGCSGMKFSKAPLA